MINNKILQLRKSMKKYNIDFYIVTMSDYHCSEYISPHFKSIEFLTGFTGSAGDLVITMNEVCLWVDGRYFIQAFEETRNKDIIIMKINDDNVPTLFEYINKNICSDMTIGFDGKTVNQKLVENLKKNIINININYKIDLISEIWNNRPKIKFFKAWILDEIYSGKSAKDKINDIRNYMISFNISTHILTSLDDIAWILNIRGSDVPYNPVVFSYFILKLDKSILFINNEALDEELLIYLNNLNIEVLDYNYIYDYVINIENENILLEKDFINYTIYQSLICKNNLIDKINPSTLMKCIKNNIEIDNIRKAHIKDAICVTKYIYQIKNKIDVCSLDEFYISKYIDDLRKEQEGYICKSFENISAYDSNAAICHYIPKKNNSKKLNKKGFYLIDSGGQYLEGTTDITRTISLGELTDRQKEHFTITVISNLRLANAKFLYGCTGANLDYISRQEFWKRGIDYNHGTGHGVGYFLNVHERPNRIHWNFLSERSYNMKLEDGMLISNEPGIYIENEYGIRIENLMLCKKTEKNSFGQFMEFETVTFVPIDLDAIDVQYMTNDDIEFLNNYHSEVYDKISSYLNKDERDWLKRYTREIKK